MKKERISDPGIGVVGAPVGSEDWAKRWRLGIQSAIKGTDFDVRQVASMLDIGKEHRAWTKLNKMDGNLFKSFEEFVAYQIPWGLSQNPERFLKMLELAMGKQTAQLETVKEPKPGERTDITLRNDYARSSRKLETNLRAINRAPSPIPDLYRQGLINQVDAARLGKTDRTREKNGGLPPAEIAAEMARVVEETKPLPPPERRKVINQAARKLANVKQPTKEELAIAAFRKAENRIDTLLAIVASLDPHELRLLEEHLKHPQAKASSATKRAK